jgi:hypothetical protein
MLRLASIAALSSLLVGCSQVSGGCPPLVTYSRAQQAQASAELRALPAGSQIGQMIVDYGKTRDACRGRP